MSIIRNLAKLVEVIAALELTFGALLSHSNFGSNNQPSAEEIDPSATSRTRHTASTRR